MVSKADRHHRVAIQSRIVRFCKGRPRSEPEIYSEIPNEDLRPPLGILTHSRNGRLDSWLERGVRFYSIRQHEPDDDDVEFNSTMNFTGDEHENFVFVAKDEHGLKIFCEEINEGHQRYIDDEMERSTGDDHDDE